MAMKIMRTWWYPTNGKKRLHPVANRTAMAALCGFLYFNFSIRLSNRPEGRITLKGLSSG
jgi:glutamate formiminotransferase